MIRPLTPDEEKQRDRLNEILKDRPKPVITEWGIPYYPEDDVERMKRIERGLLNAQLDIIKFSLYPPGSSKKFRDELDA